jgi:hypothetical protein
LSTHLRLNEHPVFSIYTVTNICPVTSCNFYHGLRLFSPSHNNVFNVNIYIISVFSLEMSTLRIITKLQSQWIRPVLLCLAALAVPKIIRREHTRGLYIQLCIRICFKWAYTLETGWGGRGIKTKINYR